MLFTNAAGCGLAAVDQYILLRPYHMMRINLTSERRMFAPGTLYAGVHGGAAR